MQYRIVFVAALASSASALPNFLRIRQGVTENIAPTEPAPAGFLDTVPGTFGIAVMNITAGGAPDPASPTSDTGLPVTQISDGQPQQSSVQVVTQITDGQPQVITAGKVTQITDGQIQAPETPAPITVTPVTQITDGQPQAPPQTTEPAVTQITDGQPQAPAETEPAVSQITDGQPQAPTETEPAVSQITDGQPQEPVQTMSPVTQISDGQIQAPAPAPAPESTAPAVTEITDGQPQAPAATEPAVSQITDGQPQAPAPTTLVAVTQIADGQIQASPAKRSVDLNSRDIMGIVGCESDSTLTLTLNDGVLTDSNGRTGYIAANRQFQFDKPAQTGAIFTAGWSVGPNGSLALGPSTTFFQCRSGGFFNLYDENIAPQCNEVTINALMLEQC